MLGAAYRALRQPGPREPDRAVLIEYVSLVGVLSAIQMIPVLL